MKDRWAMKDKVQYGWVGYALLFLLTGLCMFSALRQNNQAILASPLPQTFSGEYSLAGGEWQPLTDPEELYAARGDLVLRGHLSYDVPSGGRLNFYLNHLGYSLYVNGELTGRNTVMHNALEGRALDPSFCGELWDYIISPGITTEDELEIHLKSFHKYGNEGAYRDFLQTLCNTPDSSDIIEKYLEPQSRPFRATGWIIMIVGTMLLGAWIIALIKGMADGMELWKYGLLCLFAGGYFLLDTINFSFLKGILALNTYGRHLCMMLAIYLMEVCVSDELNWRRGSVARAVVHLSGFFDGVLILISLCGGMLIFDTMLPWALAQLVVCFILLVCCTLELIRGRWEAVAGIALFAAAALDVFGVGESIISQGTCSKIVFLVLFLLKIVNLITGVVIDHRASIRAKELEKKLEDSRIATMLSQIQPHFIYNTLSSIEQLCKDQPEVASELVHNFALYLRGNFSELDNTVPITLMKEMEHVQHYVNIEQIRFPDIEIRFELNSEDFLLPALSVQPLVENAIKHGLMGLKHGGTVTVTSYETDKDFCVSVEDNGVGFDTTILQEERRHIGIRNIRGRIEAMYGGTLQVESAPGKGTKVGITIPKERREEL